MTQPGMRERYLAAMGIPVWVLREAADSESAVNETGREPAAREAGPYPTAGEAAGLEPVAGETGRGASAGEAGSDLAAWTELEEAVSTCTRCALHRGRTRTVFGVGSRTADLLIVGEAPGAEEDRQGEPFVGRAGQLLNAMLAAIRLAREDVYIANILKCRPPGNRDPKPDEAATCTPYLERQIDLLRPRVILALGRVAAQWLLQSDAPIGRLRGRTFDFGPHSTPLVVTYHPAYLLRSPLRKSMSWDDLKIVKRLLPGPDAR